MLSSTDIIRCDGTVWQLFFIDNVNELTGARTTDYFLDGSGEDSARVVTLGVFRLISCNCIHECDGVFAFLSVLADIEEIKSSIRLIEDAFRAIVFVYDELIPVVAVVRYAILILDPCQGQDVRDAVRVIPD